MRACVRGFVFVLFVCHDAHCSPKKYHLDFWILLFCTCVLYILYSRGTPSLLKHVHQSYSHSLISTQLFIAERDSPVGVCIHIHAHAYAYAKKLVYTIQYTQTQTHLWSFFEITHRHRHTHTHTHTCPYSRIIHAYIRSTPPILSREGTAQLSARGTENKRTPFKQRNLWKFCMNLLSIRKT